MVAPLNHRSTIHLSYQSETDSQGTLDQKHSTRSVKKEKDSTMNSRKKTSTSSNSPIVDEISTIIVEDPPVVWNGSAHSPGQSPIHSPGHSNDSLGHSIPSPGHSNNSLGHSIHSPGHSNNSLGHSIHSHGHSNNSPGHSIHSPGHSNHSTGHSVHSPGHSAHSPVQSPINSPVHSLVHSPEHSTNMEAINDGFEWNDKSDNNDEDGDDDDDDNFGKEYSLAGAEEEEEGEDAEAEQNAASSEDAAAGKESSRCWRCCGGFVLCCRRCRKEACEAKDEVAECFATMRRKRIIQRWFSYDTLKTWLPCLRWIPKYRLRHLKGDVIAGITTGLSVLPQGLAYGQIVELPAQYGLYSSIMGSFAYAVLGTGKDVAVGPSAVVSILAAQYGTGRSPILKDPTYAIILALFTGIIQVAMGVLHLGFIFSFISLPVFKAFRSAAGITIFMSRIKKWWGLLGVPREFLPQLYWTLKRVAETNINDLLLGGLCILLLFTFKKLKAMSWKKKFRQLSLPFKILKKLYWILGSERNIIVVVFSSAVVYAMLNNGINISYTGVIPKGVPPFQAPNFTLSLPNSTAVLTLSDIASDIGAGFFFVPMVAMFECISVGKAFGRKGNYRIDYNQELIAVGVSNILCSFLSGHPVTGAFLRSGINMGAGVQTPAGGILASVVVILALTYVYPLFYYIPVCAMAATIMMGAVDVCTFHKFGIIWSTKKSEMVPYLVTFITSLTLGIEYGVFIGVGVSLLITLYTTMIVKIQIASSSIDGGIVVNLRSETGLLYPAADSLSRRFDKKFLSKENLPSKIVIDLSDICSTDVSIIQSSKMIQEKCKKQKTEFFLSNAQPAVDRIIRRTYLKQFIISSSGNGKAHNGTPGTSPEHSCNEHTHL